MRRFVWVILVLLVAFSLASCRAKRVANDVNWIVLDGQPSRQN